MNISNKQNRYRMMWTKTILAINKWENKNGDLMAVRFKMIREKKDLTQKSIADVLGISKTNYNYFENEERIIPLKHLNNYCNIFEVSMDYIFKLSNANVVSKNCVTLNRILVGERIREVRKNKKLTQKQLAKLLNTSQSTISSYENGETLILTSFLYELCKRLDVSMDYITGRSNVKKRFELND